MISIIVYGRNDEHGYNLHKRAAISLNCLSHVLQAPDDELIFVDYNSPDQLPTFPEAIADTLTPEARARLRILRARPCLHRRFAAATRLSVVEPIARNIGLRRSNPANRWILSTNTDVILLPRKAPTLNDIAQSLSDGFYHTPRFEIPESLWETFERSNTRSILAETRRLGRMARLNNVVHSSDLVLYDGPGDCQFIRREDLFAIDGFDERMVLGWHVDSNLAKRLTLRCGPVRSLIDELFCYHCNHLRISTAVHARWHIGNDYRTFVDEIVQPDLPQQRSTWGWAEEELEEIRLPNSNGVTVRMAIESTTLPLDRDFTQQWSLQDDFDDIGYDAQTVVPFLADLLGQLPRRTSLAFCGVRRDTFDLLLRVWHELGFELPVLLDRTTADYLGVEQREHVSIVDGTVWRAEADLFAFEFGRASDGFGGRPIARAPADDDALSLVQAAFLAAVADERLRMACGSAYTPRRFIGINCVRNRSEGLFAAQVASPLTSLGSRLQQGFVKGAIPEVPAEIAVRCAIAHALGCAAPISEREVAFVRELFQPLLDGIAIPPDRQPCAAANAALGLAYVEAIGKGRQAAEHAAALRALRPSAAIEAELGFSVIERPQAPGERSPSRYAGWEDWDDATWGAFSDEIAPDSKQIHHRGAAVWEQIHILYGLHRYGALGNRARVLVIATLPDRVIAALSRRLGRVDVFEAARPAGTDGVSRRRFWSDDAPYDPNTLNILKVGAQLEQFDAETYDAVVFPHGAMFADGIDGAVAWLRAAARLIAPNGLLVFKSEIAAGPAAHPNFFDAGFVEENGFAEALEQLTPFEVEGGFDRGLSRATLDRVSPDGVFGAEGYFLTRINGRLLIPGIWFLRKRVMTDRARWEQLRRWPMTRRLGEQIGNLLIGPAGRRNADGSIATRPETRGHVFFGPYIRVRPGRYRVLATVRVRHRWPVRRLSRVVLEAVFAGEILASQNLRRQDLRDGVIRLEFAVDPALMPADPVMELRAFSPGGIDLTFRSVALELTEASDTGPWPSLPASGRPDLGLTGLHQLMGQGAVRYDD